MSSDVENIQRARHYLKALEKGVPFQELSEFYTPDVVQYEYPNQLVPTGARRDLAQLREANERGREVVASQRFDIRRWLASEATVALEVEWSATLKVAVGGVPAGGQMRAHFAMFLEFRGGKIAVQRNYDCFEPW
jgi:ketosteroid isomerase-like protein